MGGLITRYWNWNINLSSNRKLNDYKHGSNEITPKVTRAGSLMRAGKLMTCLEYRWTVPLIFFIACRDMDKELSCHLFNQNWKNRTDKRQPRYGLVPTLRCCERSFVVLTPAHRVNIGATGITPEQSKTKKGSQTWLWLHFTCLIILTLGLCENIISLQHAGIF